MQELTQTEIDWIRDTCGNKNERTKLKTVAFVGILIGLSLMLLGALGQLTSGAADWTESFKALGFVGVFTGALFLARAYERHVRTTRAVLTKLAPDLHAFESGHDAI